MKDYEYDLKTLRRMRDLYYIDENSGCFIWIGAINNKGYAQIAYRGKTCLAHKIHYIIRKGPYDESLDLDHVVCETNNCVNPDHLEPVTHRVNNQRGWGGNEDTCSRGHPRTDENTYTYIRHKKNKKNPYTERQCRICLSENSKKYYNEKV